MKELFMKKIKVTVCTGTACFVMGASDLMLLKEKLPDELRDKVEIVGCTCMNECKGDKNGMPPYIKIEDQVMHAANVPDIIARLTEIVESR
jgi:NADH:ubiquinone oxidoreductase subunit E